MARTEAVGLSSAFRDHLPSSEVPNFKLYENFSSGICGNMLIIISNFLDVVKPLATAIRVDEAENGPSKTLINMTKYEATPPRHRLLFFLRTAELRSEKEAFNMS